MAAIRQTFIDRRLSAYNGSITPKYNVNIFNERQLFQLMNNAAVKGTPINAGTLTNLLDFNNIISFGDTEMTTTGYFTPNCTFTLTEKTADAVTGIKRLVLRQIWTQTAENTWNVRENVYDLNELNENVIVLDRWATVKKSAGEWEWKVTVE